MDKQRRREIANAFKEKKVARGVFAVRCAPTGETWLGVSRNLAAQQNSIWFSLRMGSNSNRPMQAAWTKHGESAFELTTVEVIDTEDLSPYLVDALLKDRLRHWLAELGAKPLVA